MFKVVLLLGAGVAVSSAAAAGGDPCAGLRPHCACVIGRPRFASAPDGRCRFACQIGAAASITCDANERLRRRSGCKNRPAPCECKIGEPRWIGEPPNCDFGCELGQEVGGRTVTCEKSAEMATATCEYLAKPCACVKGAPIWIGEPPDGCRFYCRIGEELATC